MSERLEFLRFAKEPGANLSELCRRFGVSRKTGYKWRRRAEANDVAEHSRRPLRSPAQTPQTITGRVVELRRQHPAWGGRKLHHVLRREGATPLPAPSTVNSILKREGLLAADRRLKRDWQRFEEERPNALWQMDFKGPVQTASAKAHVLTILDDHSRFNLCLAVCPDQRRESVQSQLVCVFERYGLPERMLMDNGPPWGSAGQTAAGYSHTQLSAWLIRQGVSVSHGRPYHPQTQGPQTQGKEERFRRSFGLEVLAAPSVWPSLTDLQRACDRWRAVYNLERPHEAIGHEPPVSCYTPSLRPYLDVAPGAYPYASTDEVRRVQATGEISFRGQALHISRGLIGETVALRHTGNGAWDVYYCHQRIARIDLEPSANV